MNFTKPKNVGRKTFSSEARDRVYYNALMSGINEIDTLEKSAASYSNKWLDSVGQNTYLGIKENYYKKVNDIKSQLEASSDLYKRVMGEEQYNNLYANIKNESSNQAKDMANTENLFNLYSKYETAEDYNAAYKLKDYNTYKDLKAYLDSDDYKAEKAAGNISEKDISTARNKLYSLAMTKDLEEEIKYKKKLLAGPGADAPQLTMQNLKPSTELFNPDDLNVDKNKLEEWAKSKGYKNYAEYERDLSNIQGEIEVLESIAAQKKKQEDFDKKWADEFENMEKSAYTSNADISKILVGEDYTGDEVWGRSKFGTEMKPSKVSDYEDYEKYLTKNQKLFINYLNDYKGQETAQKYFKDLIAVSLDKQYNQGLMQGAYDFSADGFLGGVGGSLASVATSLASGVEYTSNLLSGKSDRMVRTATMTQGLREGTKSQIDSEFWDFVYDTGMSGVDSLAAAGIGAVVPFAGEILLGGSAAASTYNDALNRGVTGGDAILSSIAAGAAESLFEHLSIGKLFDIKDITGGFTKAGIKQAAKKIGADILVNASEETLTEVANIVTDQLINTDLSSYAIAVKDYYMQGMSIEEARAKAASDLGSQVLTAMASGALMGFGFGGLSAGTGLVSSQIKNSKIGNTIISNNNVETLKTFAAESGISDIVKDAEKLTEKSKPSKVGSVFNRLYENATQKSIEAMTPMLMENGATKSGSNSAKGWADYIYKTAISPKSTKTVMQEAMLRTNSIAGDVYSAFVDEGKYGGDTLLALNELVTPAKAQTAAEGDSANGMGNGDAIDNENESFFDEPNIADTEQGPQTLGEQVFKTPKKLTKDQTYVKEVGERLGRKVIYEYTEQTKGFKSDGYIDKKTGVIHIDYSNESPLQFILKHELTHFLEINKTTYSDFANLIMDSEAFSEWVKSKKYESVGAYKQAIIDLYLKIDPKFGEPDANKEMLANFVGEKLFGNDLASLEKLLKAMEPKQRRTFMKFIKDFIKYLKEKFIKDTSLTAQIEKFEKQFIEAYRAAETEFEQQKTADNNSSTKFLYVGEKSKLADKLKLATAKDWLKKGIDSEAIRKETGWFKGMDGKWRFEISDKEADINFKNILNDILAFWDFSDLKTQFAQGTISAEEYTNKTIEAMDADWNKRTLKDYFKHEKLFEAYPELAEISIQFNTLDGKATGAYDPALNCIWLEPRVIKSPDAYDVLIRSLIHETQHAIQYIEGFTKGASGVYWKAMAKEGKPARYKNGEEMPFETAYRNTAGEIEAYDASRRRLLDDDERKNIRPDIDREDVVFADEELKELAPFGTENMQYSIPGDHNYVYTDGKASFTEERLNNLFDEHSLGDGKRAEHSNAYVAYVSPEDFINLTSNENIRGRVEDEAYILNEEELKNESETPFIEYDPTTGEVVNHEGRHRMVALKADGIKNVAVVIKPSTDSFERREAQDISLTGQNFAGGRAGGKVTVKNAIPLNEKYRTEATAQFAQNPDADIRYSIPDNTNAITNPIKQYSKERQLIIKDYLSSTSPKLMELIEATKNGNVKFTRHKIGDVSSREVKDIENLLGVDVSGYTHDINTNGIKHILKRHGENGKQDDSMSIDEDIARVGWVLQNYDDVELLYEKGELSKSSEFMDSNNNPAVQIRYIKKIDGTYYVVEAVADNSYKKLWVQSAYLEKNNEDGTQAPNADKIDPETTAKTAPTSSSSKSIISNEDENVKKDKFYLPLETPESLVDMYDNNQITKDELISRLNQSRNRKAETPLDIARMTEEDANTTPPLKRKQGEAKGDSESKLYTSLQKSDIFNDEFKAEFKKDSFIKKYQSVGNAETMREAAKELDAGGQAYVNAWNRKDAKHASLIDIAVGFILLDRYQRIGDKDSAAGVGEKLREMATASGQQVQIFSILGRFDADSMALYAQKELAKAFEIFKKEKTKRWLDNNADRFNLTDDDIEFIRRRTLQAAEMPENSREKAVLLGEIASRVQDKLPPNKGQAYKAFQRIAMLLNPKTLERNIIGNATITPVFIASDYFGTVVDKIVSLKTGVRTTGAFKANSVKSFGKGIYESYDDFKRHIHTKQEQLNRFDIGGGKSFNENHRGLLKPLNTISKTLNAADRLTSFCLEVGDRPFYEMWFINSLNNQMRLNNVTEATPEMVEIATEEALERTWQNDNYMTKAASGARTFLNYVSYPVYKVFGFGLGDIFIKFTKTPANLAKALIDFSPVSIAKVGYDAVQLTKAIQKGEFDSTLQKKLVNDISKSIMGILAMILTAALSEMGALTGGGDDDKDLAYFEKNLAGKAPYSVIIGDTSISYEWLQPISGLVAMVTDYMKSAKENPDNEWYDNLKEAFKAGGTVLFNQSFMKNIQQLFSSDDIFGNLWDGILSEPSVFVPQILSQTASAIDEYSRDTYENDNLQTAINKVKVKIPGLRETLPKSVDTLGNEMENQRYGILNSFFNPANVYPENSVAVADEVYGLYKSTGDATVIPRKAPYNLTVKGIKHTFATEERAEFQKVVGATSNDIIDNLLNERDYEDLLDSQKIELITTVYNYATAKAKSNIIYSYDIISAMYGGSISEELYNRLTEAEKKKLAELYFMDDYYDSKYKPKFEQGEEAEYFLEKLLDKYEKEEKQSQKDKYKQKEVNKIVN